jgi:predicted nucleotidyltransferase
VAEQIDLAFIYGSVARGQETAGSDIDLMLVGSIGFDEAVCLLWPLQAELGREINPQLLSRQEFAARAQEPFMRDVLSKPKIFVMGTEDELAEFAGGQP